MDEQQDQNCRMSVVKEQVSSQRMVPKVKGSSHFLHANPIFECHSMIKASIGLRFCSFCSRSRDSVRVHKKVQSRRMDV